MPCQDVRWKPSDGCRVCSLLEKKEGNGKGHRDFLGHETCKTQNPSSASTLKIDVVFLSHPDYGSSLFSLWWPSPQGWKPSWWMHLLGPPLSIVIPFLWPYLRNGEFMEVAEDTEYSGIRMQNWVLSSFGYQYVIWPFRQLVAVAW